MGVTMSEFEWRFLVVWALLWCMGWGLQGLSYLMYHLLSPEKRGEESRGFLAEQVNVKWYWRPLLGYPPTNGKVGLRPGVFQITAIIMAAIWSTLALVTELRNSGLAFFLIYGLLNILILAFLNRSRSEPGRSG